MKEENAAKKQRIQKADEERRIQELAKVRRMRDRVCQTTRIVDKLQVLPDLITFFRVKDKALMLKEGMLPAISSLLPTKYETLYATIIDDSLKLPGELIGRNTDQLKLDGHISRLLDEVEGSWRVEAGELEREGETMHDREGETMHDEGSEGDQNR